MIDQCRSVSAHTATLPDVWCLDSSVYARSYNVQVRNVRTSYNQSKNFPSTYIYYCYGHTHTSSLYIHIVETLVSSPLCYLNHKIYISGKNTDGPEGDPKILTRCRRDLLDGFPKLNGNVSVWLQNVLRTVSDKSQQVCCTIAVYRCDVYLKVSTYTYKRLPVRTQVQFVAVLQVCARNFGARNFHQRKRYGVN